jgi:hypothetical protein
MATMTSRSRLRIASTNNKAEDELAGAVSGPCASLVATILNVICRPRLSPQVRRQILLLLPAGMRSVLGDMFPEGTESAGDWWWVYSPVSVHKHRNYLSIGNEVMRSVHKDRNLRQSHDMYDREISVSRDCRETHFSVLESFFNDCCIRPDAVLVPSSLAAL